jgi:hypothetical protein
MDTLIITTTAAVVGQTARSAASVAEALNASILQAKSSENATRSLQYEVKGFGDACDALQSLLRGLAGSKIEPIETQDEQFYIKLQQAMSEFAMTVDRLGQKIRYSDSVRSSFLRPGRGQLKLKDDEILRGRQRIDSHLQSVQMILATVNL